jgi:hypothetical protein
LDSRHVDMGPLKCQALGHTPDSSFAMAVIVSAYGG